MRKLRKSSTFEDNSVEMYFCICGCGCSCGCFCFLFINSSTNSSSLDRSTRGDNDSAARFHGHRTPGTPIWPPDIA